MELTEETLKTIERLSQSGWQSDAETVLALVVEIERQRAEIERQTVTHQQVCDALEYNTTELANFAREITRRDAAIAALRYTLEGIRGEAMSMRGAGMDASNMGYSAILITTLAENALSETAAPDAPARAGIAVGDRVRVTSGR